MIKFLIIILIVANVLAVICLAPIVALALFLAFGAKLIYQKSADFFKKYLNYRKQIELKP